MIYRRLKSLLLTLLSLSVLLGWAIARGAEVDFPRATGLRELSVSEESLILRQFEEWEPPATRAALPNKVINTRYLPTVGSQGSLGICGSFIVYYYLHSYYHAKALGLSFRPDPASSPQHVFSPAWGVIMAPHAVSGGAPWGAWPSSCIESIMNIGCLTWKRMPYSDDHDKPSEDKFYRQLPTAAQMRAALPYKAITGLYISDIQTPAGLLKLKSFLASGNIASAIWEAPLTTNFDYYPDATEAVTVNGKEIGNVNNNVYAWPSIAAGRSDGHAVTIVGYDDTLQYKNKSGHTCQGALLIVNSWGSHWGISPGENIEGGFAWIGYEVVQQHKKIASTAYSMAVSNTHYQALLLGTFTLQDLSENNWKTSIGSNQVYWPSLLKASAHGNPLNLDFDLNSYVTKSNTELPEEKEYLFDLSSLASDPFPTITMSLSLLDYGEVGKISNLSIERRTEESDGSWSEKIADVPDVDFTLQRYGSQCPSSTVDIAPLQEKALNIEGFHPQIGSSAWGDANGDGHLDLAISSYQKVDILI